MFRYEICNQADKEIFEKQCIALKKNIPSLIEVENLQDVDGSITRVYKINQQKLFVHNSVYLNEVYIESDIKLEKYFN